MTVSFIRKALINAVGSSTRKHGRSDGARHDRSRLVYRAEDTKVAWRAIYLSTVQNRSYPRSSSHIKSSWQEKQTIITPILPPSGTALYCGTAIGGHAPEPLSFFGFLMSEHRTRGFGVLRASSRFSVYKGRQSSAPINRGWGEPRKLAPNHAKTANFRGKARSSKKNGF